MSHWGGKKLTKEQEEIMNLEISEPTNFKQIHHVGVGSDGTINLDNIPPEWKSKLRQAGVKKKDLKDDKFREEMFAMLAEDDKKAPPTTSNAAPPPPPPRGTSSGGVPPPVPAGRGHGASAPPPPPPRGAAGGPPPPVPAGRGVNAGPGASAGAGGPPPPPGFGGPPPPPGFGGYGAYGYAQQNQLKVQRVVDSIQKPKNKLKAVALSGLTGRQLQNTIFSKMDCSINVSDCFDDIEELFKQKETVKKPTGLVSADYKYNIMSSGKPEAIDELVTAIQNG